MVQTSPGSGADMLVREKRIMQTIVINNRVGSIIGTTVMVTSGSHNPTLTAQALGGRTAEYLTKSWKSIANA